MVAIQGNHARRAGMVAAKTWPRKPTVQLFAIQEVHGYLQTRHSFTIRTVL